MSILPQKNANLIGRKFGHLTVIAKADKKAKSGENRWVCQCDCGKKTVAATNHLTSGRMTSCGHIHRSNRPYETNTTGHRNISIRYRGGNKYYRVRVVGKNESKETEIKRLDDALAVREEYRRELWPSYKTK